MALRGTKIEASLRSTLAPIADMEGGQYADRRFSLQMASGTGSNQADKLFSDERTLAGTTAEDLDLQTLTDANGTALALAEVAALVIEVGSANDGDLEVEPGASNGWDNLFGASGAVLLRPGSFNVFATGTNPAWAVDATHKVLNINNLGASSGTYRITLLGRSA